MPPDFKMSVYFFFTHPLLSNVEQFLGVMWSSTLSGIAIFIENLDSPLYFPGSSAWKKVPSEDSKIWGPQRNRKLIEEKWFASKGQLFSKVNCQAVNSSKKRTNEFFRLFPIISISQKFFSIFFLTLEKIGIDEKVICYHNISN